MKSVLTFIALSLLADSADARMVCRERPTVDVTHYDYKAIEQPGGTCGRLSEMIVYADRNGSDLLTGTFFGGAHSELSPNRCVEKIEGFTYMGRQWAATESWSTDGHYMFGLYKVRQDWQGESCDSEYTVTMTRKRTQHRKRTVDTPGEP